MACGMLNVVSSSKGSREEEAMDLLIPDEVEDKEHAKVPDEPDDEDFLTVPCEAGGIVEPRRRPGNSTEEEVAQHNPTHFRYRSWCPVRAEAQGREDLRYRATKEDFHNEAPGCIHGLQRVE